MTQDEFITFLAEFMQCEIIELTDLIFNISRSYNFIEEFCYNVTYKNITFKGISIRSGNDTVVLIRKSDRKVLHLTTDKLKFQLLQQNVFNINYEYICMLNGYYIGYIEELKFLYGQDDKPFTKTIKKYINKYSFEYVDPLKAYSYNDMLKIVYNIIDDIEASNKRNKMQLIYFFNKLISVIDIWKNDTVLNNYKSMFDVHNGNIAIDKDGNLIPFDIVFCK